MVNASISTARVNRGIGRYVTPPVVMIDVVSVFPARVGPDIKICLGNGVLSHVQYLRDVFVARVSP
eukprot:11182549-Lingulodinium_polyedra.AAC.1